MDRHTESMSAKTKQLRVVVDAGVGRDSALLHQASDWLGERIGEMFWLDDAHHGIPDVEILDKVLGNDMVLVTRDCVLHNRAHKKGFLSLTLDRQGRLTQRPLPRIRLPKQEAASTAAELRAACKPTRASRIWTRAPAPSAHCWTACRSIPCTPAPRAASTTWQRTSGINSHAPKPMKL
jgi:hypothetical protein